MLGVEGTGHNRSGRRSINISSVSPVQTITFHKALMAAVWFMMGVESTLRSVQERNGLYLNYPSSLEITSLHFKFNRISEGLVYAPFFCLTFHFRFRIISAIRIPHTQPPDSLPCPSRPTASYLPFLLQ